MPNRGVDPPALEKNGPARSGKHKNAAPPNFSAPRSPLYNGPTLLGRGALDVPSLLLSCGTKKSRGRLIVSHHVAQKTVFFRRFLNCSIFTPLPTPQPQTPRPPTLPIFPPTFSSPCMWSRSPVRPPTSPRHLWCGRGVVRVGRLNPRFQLLFQSRGRSKVGCFQ